MSLHSSVAEVGNDLSCEKILQTNTFVKSEETDCGRICNICIGSNREQVFHPLHVEEML